jgi:hypothetical protein
MEVPMAMGRPKDARLGCVDGPTERPFLSFDQFGMVSGLLRGDVAVTLHNASIHFFRAYGFSTRIENLPRGFVPRHHEKRKFDREMCASEHCKWDFVCRQILSQPGAYFFCNFWLVNTLALKKALPSDGVDFKSP